MSHPSLATLNRIIRDPDHHIDAKEFVEIEAALFRGDGLVDELEKDYITSLLGPQDSTNGYSFEDPTDLLRLRTILDHNAVTVTRYLAAIARFGLPSKNDSTKLMLQSVQHMAPSPDQPVVRGLKPWDNGLQIILKQKEAEFTIVIDQQEYNLPALAKTLAPFNPLVIFESVETYRQRTTDRATKDHALAILRTIHQAYKQSGELRFNHNHDDKFLGDATAIPLPTEEFFRKDTPLKISISGIGVALFGEFKYTDSKEALKLALGVMPQGLVDILSQSKSQIHINDTNLTAIGYLNQFPEFKEIASVGGVTLPAYPDPSFITINNNLSPHSLCIATVHEAGHVLYGYLEYKTGGEFKSYFGLKPMSHKRGRFGEVVQFHFDHLRSPSAPVSTRHASIYGATADTEWFPEAFAIYALGKKGRDLGLDYSSAFDGRPLSHKESLDEFKREDPVGYLMMAKLYQALEQKTIQPEQVFSWTVYLAAHAFVHKYGGDITAGLENQWLQETFDFSFEEKYWDVASKKWGDPVKKFLALQNLFANKNQGFYPAERDYVIALLEIHQKRGGRKSILTPEQIIKNLISIINMNHHDQKVFAALKTLVSYDAKNPGTYDTKFMDDPSITRMLEEITSELAKLYPNNRNIIELRALWLFYQGEDASTHYSQLIQMLTQQPPKDPLQMQPLYTEYKTKLAISYQRKKQFDQAEEILISLNPYMPVAQYRNLIPLYDDWDRPDKIISLFLSVPEETRYFDTFHNMTRLTPMAVLEKMRHQPKWPKLQEKIKALIAVVEKDETLKVKDAGKISELKMIYQI